MIPDDEHLVFYPEAGDVKTEKQRAFRAFVVFVDSVLGEKFYGEGRITHNLLLKRLCDRYRLASGDEKTDDEIFDEISDPNGEFIFIKGFLSSDEFADMSEKNRRILETPIYDKDGGVIETPRNWFVTGHNLPETSKN